MTLVGGYEHGHLRQVNVGVEIINKPKRDWDICTMPGGDETRCAIVKPVYDSSFGRCRSFIGFDTRARTKCREIG